MLTNKQINEIKEHLEKAQNPLFFFDNDNDGLMSFLLLQRFIGRGKGIAVKGGNNLNTSYFRRVSELKPDYVFILDVPKAEKEFLDMVDEANLPVVWIDHHDVSIGKDVPKGNFDYYNPYHNDKTNEPVSYLSYKITNNKKDIWLAVIGCISDFYIPDFYKEFEEKYPDLAKKNPTTAFDVLYDSEIGRISRILDFSLKDTTTNVVNMLKFMMKVKEPIDILQEDSKTKRILERYNEINTKYQKILSKARRCVGDKLLFFQYSGDLSLSANISNQLIHEFPKKIIVVVYFNNDVASASLRSRKDVDIRKITLEAIKDLPGAVGGGHKNATGARMNFDDLPKFREKIEELVDKN